MLYLPAITGTHGAGSVIDISTAAARQDKGFVRDSMEDRCANKDFEILLHVGSLSRADGHILTYLDVDDLRLPAGQVTADDVFERADTTGLAKHNAQVANIFQHLCSAPTCQSLLEQTGEWHQSWP